jgi:uncharacterized damage-inducible protein DinB
MFTNIEEFTSCWTQEAESTRKIFAQLTDDSLGQPVEAGGRTLGRMAWHITLTVPEMMSHTGLVVGNLTTDAPLPAKAKEILNSYQAVSSDLLGQIREHWKDETLQIVDDMYGERWKRGFTLMALVHHQIHHRGQMTVLMRQAKLRVPGVYGPAREEWAAWQMPEPAV